MNIARINFKFWWSLSSSNIKYDLIVQAELFMPVCKSFPINGYNIFYNDPHLFKTYG